MESPDTGTPAARPLPPGPLNDLARAIHQNAVDHGWWDKDRNFAEVIALCHSELSEALEEYRNGQPPVYYPQATDAARGKPEGQAVELADCIIRILDYCGRAGLDMDAILREKHEYNKGRPYRHGHKRC